MPRGLPPAATKVAQTAHDAAAREQDSGRGALQLHKVGVAERTRDGGPMVRNGRPAVPAARDSVSPYRLNVGEMSSPRAPPDSAARTARISLIRPIRFASPYRL